MAVSSNEVTVRLSMNEVVYDLVQRLGALNPYAVSELVLRNCLQCEPAALCEQIGRCVRLRRLSSVACALQPSKLVKLMLQRLRYLEKLELSLVHDSEAVGGDRNFELLWELLVFCPNLTELHVHFVRGTFSSALVQCHRIHEQLDRLETFTFTSEMPASVPLPYGPDPSLAFANCATLCANVCHDKPHDWWSCVELSRLVLSRDRVLILPSQLVAFAVGDFTAGMSFQEASRRHSWARVRKLCLLLLPPEPSVVWYPTAGAKCRDYLERFSFALDSIVELNVSSFHFRLDVDLRKLLRDTPLGRRLLALSAPPCWFPRSSSVRGLPLGCPNLRDLDVRVVSPGGHLRCASCHNLLFRTDAVQEPSDAATSSTTSIARLTLCDVPYEVLPWYLECYRAAATLRLAEWRLVGSPPFGHLCGLLGECVAIRCLVLQHRDLPINDQHLQASLSRMTSLQHLCLLTSTRVSDMNVLNCVRDSVSRAAQLKCVHIHYKRDTDGWDQRVTWLNRRQGEVLLQEGPCFACCSTATFIGLVKPVNRDCEVDL
ncbi:hypothetical protein HPB52_005957 [Rhipicephalus sanguineus]|uniref:Uncharacterized protein n=1 Tax=Rhipicephalus sanguineus TaxID=34632 RepID=A0A9D4PII4_RHISA|nr:hypothetical protein HPB52_005957 [Rhipicephalus sanguineus]